MQSIKEKTADEMKFIILKSYYASEDRVILKEKFKTGSSLKATLGYLLKMGTFNENDEVLVLSEDTDSVQIRPKAIYKNNKGYYIKQDNKRVYLTNTEIIETVIKELKESIG